MERSLLWSAFAMGWVGWLCGMLLTRARREETAKDARIPRSSLLAAIALPALVFLATLPSRPPFASGQGWGRGFVLGAAGALLSVWVLARARRAVRHPLTAAASIAAPFSLALVAVAVPLLWTHDTAVDALLGIAIGWLCVSFVLHLAPPSPAFQGEGRVPQTRDGQGGWGSEGLAASVGFTVTLCAVAALGAYRGPIAPDPASREAPWSAIALAFAAGIPFTLLLTALPAPLLLRAALKIPFAGLIASLAAALMPDDDRRRLAARGWRWIVAVALLAGLGKLLSVKAAVQPHLFHLVGVGLAVGLVAWWLLAEGPSRESRVESREAADPNTEHRTPNSDYNGALAVLTVLAGFIVSYQMMAGFGVGLMLLAAWPALAFALSASLESDAQDSRLSTLDSRLSTLLLFGALLLLYRLFTVRFEDDLRGANLSDHYAVFGLLAGAMLPIFLAGFLARSVAVSASPGSRLFRLALAGVLTLLIPGGILLLWGTKCALALLLGLALAGVMQGLEFRVQVTPSPFLPFSPSLFALAAALALTQWTHHVLPLAEMSRAEKTRVLSWTIGILLALILASDYGGRFMDWRRRRGGQPSPPDPGLKSGSVITKSEPSLACGLDGGTPSLRRIAPSLACDTRRIAVADSQPAQAGFVKPDRYFNAGGGRAEEAAQ